jgi:START domain
VHERQLIAQLREQEAARRASPGWRVVGEAGGLRVSRLEPPDGPPLFLADEELEGDWDQLGEVLIAQALTSQRWWAPDYASGQLLEEGPGWRRVHLRYRSSGPLLAPRDYFVLEGLWRAPEGWSTVGCSQPGPPLVGHVRARIILSSRHLRPIAGGRCRMEALWQVDLGGWLPAWMVAAGIPGAFRAESRAIRGWLQAQGRSAHGGGRPGARSPGRSGP